MSGLDERLASAHLPALTRDAWLEIDVEALAGNYSLMRELAGPGVEAWAVVKSDGYGHGIEMAAEAFIGAGAERLCIATLDEALYLRRFGVTAPLVLLFPIPVLALETALQAGGLELAASDGAGTRELLLRWQELAGSGTDAEGLALHLEIETGLGRGGVPAEDAVALARQIAQTPGIRLSGVWTHLATAEDEAACRRQVDEFEAAVAAIQGAGINVPMRHMTASGALIAGHGPAYEAVRPGLAMYGVLPPDLPDTERVRDVARRLRPALVLKARPARIETLPVGAGVSYNSRWRAERPSRIATLPLGYGDGFARAYWPGAEVIAGGRRLPVVGTVAMDSVMVDITDAEDLTADDEMVLLGDNGGQAVDADELARRRNTISWEVLTAMAQRLPRVYHARAVPLAVRTLLGLHRPSEGEENV